MDVRNGPRLDPDTGLELAALICSEGREPPRASTFRTLPEFYQLASICLGFNRLQPAAILYGVGGGFQSRNSVASAVIYARTPAVASRVRLRGRSKFLGLHLPMRSVYKYPSSMIPCSPTTLTHFSCRRVLDFLIWTQSHACVCSF